MSRALPRYLALAVAFFVTATGLRAQELPGPATRLGFGFSVAIAGDTLVVGAPYEAGPQGNDVGAAYVYQRTGGQWQQTARITSIDPRANDNFGYSVAVWENIIAVGKPNRFGPGVVELFLPAIGWQWNSNVAPPTPTNGFGRAMAMRGNVLAVGNPLSAGETGASSAGQVCFYNVNGGSPLPPALLYAPDGAVGDQFGSAVALTDNGLIVGAPYHDAGGNANAGAAYVFSPGASSASFLTKLTATDGAAGDRFGFSVAMHSDRAIVGAPFKTQGTIVEGAAYVFSASPSWQQDGKLALPGSVTGPTGFGYTVAMSANHVAVASDIAMLLVGNTRARVLLYERVGRSWLHRASYATDVTKDTRSPSLAMQSTELLAGFPTYYSSAAVGEAGSAFTYPVPQPPAGADLQLYTGEPTSLRPAPHNVEHTPGQAWIGHAQEWPITVHNAGSFTLQISGASLSTESAPAITMDPIGFGGLSVPPGATATITLRTNFDTAGPHTATLSVVSNDASPAPYMLPLTFTAQLKPAPPGLRISREGNAVVLRYPQQPGISSYQAQRSTTLGGWQTLGSLNYEYDPGEQASFYTFRDTAPPPGSRVFYRVKIQ